MVCALTGIPSATLDYWARTGLVRPSLVGPEGRRYTRWWSIADVVAVRAVKALREAGCPLQKVRRAQTIVKQMRIGQPVGEVVLFWDGSDVLALEEWGNLVSALKHPGQMVLHLVALPVTHWSREAEASAVEVDLSELRQHRKARRAPSRTPTAQLIDRAGA